jgi:hypothetical protein
MFQTTNQVYLTFFVSKKICSTVRPDPRVLQTETPWHVQDTQRPLRTYHGPYPHEFDLFHQGTTRFTNGFVFCLSHIYIYIYILIYVICKCMTYKYTQKFLTMPQWWIKNQFSKKTPFIYIYIYIYTCYIYFWPLSSISSLNEYIHISYII